MIPRSPVSQEPKATTTLLGREPCKFRERHPTAGDDRPIARDGSNLERSSELYHETVDAAIGYHDVAATAEDHDLCTRLDGRKNISQL